MRLWKVSGRILLFNGLWQVASSVRSSNSKITHCSLHQKFCRKQYRSGLVSCQKPVSQKCTHNMWFIKQNVSYQTEARNTTNNCALGAVLRDFRSCCRDLSLIEGNLVPDRAVQGEWHDGASKNTFPAESNRTEIQNICESGRRQEKRMLLGPLLGKYDAKAESWQHWSEGCLFLRPLLSRRGWRREKFWFCNHRQARVSVSDAVRVRRSTLEEEPPTRAVNKNVVRARGEFDRKLKIFNPWANTTHQV